MIPLSSAEARASKPPATRLARTPIVVTTGQARRQASGVVYVNVIAGWFRREGRSVSVSPSTRRLLIALLANSPSLLSRTELADLLWSGRADGGPECADGVIRVWMMQARHAAAALGFVIETEGWRGWRARAAMIAEPE